MRAKADQSLSLLKLVPGISRPRLRHSSNRKYDPQILGMVLRGYPNRYIALVLDVKLNYVKYRMTAIMKLNSVKTRAHLIAKLRPLDGELLKFLTVNDIPVRRLD